MTNLLRILAAAATLLLAPLAAFADVYLVTDISVDVTDETGSTARTRAFNQARVAAANQLISRLTTYQDRAEAGLVVNNEIANRLASAIDVQEEKQTATRYLGTLSVKFDPAAVDAFLKVFGVPYVDSQDARALILPHAGSGVDAGQWVDVWAGTASENTLAPYVGGDKAYPSVSTWSIIAQDVVNVGARRGVLASASASGPGFYVRMSDIRAGQDAPRVIGVVGPFATLEQARESVISYLENDWKARTIVRADSESSVSAIARFSSRAGWIEIERALKTSRLIKSMQVETLTNEGADLRLVYLGRPDQLSAELRAGGVVLSTVEEGWLLQSALGR